jgi:hypothetical protein
VGISSLYVYVDGQGGVSVVYIYMWTAKVSSSSLYVYVDGQGGVSVVYM